MLFMNVFRVFPGSASSHCCWQDVHCGFGKGNYKRIEAHHASEGSQRATSHFTFFEQTSHPVLFSNQNL
jgi:hypothetical protein